MFIGRGVKQNQTISTSSMIFVIQKQEPKQNQKLEVYNYNKKEDSIQKVLKSIKKKSNKKIVSQKFLLDNYLNWIFLKLDDFELVDINHFIGYSNYYPTQFYPDDQAFIQLPKNSQGYVTLSKKYKILWGKSYSNQFYFTDRKVLPSMSHTQFIASDDRQELMYLFSLLNSKISQYIFKMLFQLGNERTKIFIVVKRIKEFLRVPVITESNEALKKEIIKCTQELFEMEKLTLKDVVDFKNVINQKYTSIELNKDRLIIKYNEKQIECKIKSHKEFVKNSIEKIQLDGNDTKNLTQLKNTPIFSLDRHQKLKNYIDNLVFTLYFQVQINELGFEHSDKIKNICIKNEYYSLIHKNVDGF